MEFKDYYATLGVPKTATDKEIKQAYRKLARKLHPDVNPGDKSAESRFKEINEAHEVIGDPEKRKKYDELGANWRLYEQAEAAGHGSPFGAGSPFGGNVRYGTGGPGGYRTMTQEEMNEMFGEGGAFSDFFNMFFGGTARDQQQQRRSARGRTRARQGEDVEREIELTLDEAFSGTTRRLAIKDGGHARTVDVRIPAGVKEGSRVRVPGEGERGAGGGSAGDLYLRVHLAAHAQFERKGQDLHTRVAVPLTTAVLGGEVNVPTLTGRPLRLKIPPTTQASQVFRLKGQGMPAIGKPDQRGDLYAAVDVQLPRELSAEQRKHFEELRKLEGTS
jgi:DnaJ-class molecular chaperone